MGKTIQVSVYDLECLEKENEELKKENEELKKFVNFVKGLKTHEDFNRLRNVILATNKKFKNK